MIYQITVTGIKNKFHPSSTGSTVEAFIKARTQQEAAQKATAIRKALLNAGCHLVINNGLFETMPITESQFKSLNKFPLIGISTLNLKKPNQNAVRVFERLQGASGHCASTLYV
ncbi:hypothetical protein [Vibrio harveyi]|uniref:hypothetical protein n=1 Tax=Vibrio harveyi TaxID=669 RepID=UPI0018F24421|nr:hypothetical protein [Vibrio harveyi]